MVKIWVDEADICLRTICNEGLETGNREGDIWFLFGEPVIERKTIEIKEFKRPLKIIGWTRCGHLVSQCTG